MIEQDQNLYVDISLVKYYVGGMIVDSILFYPMLFFIGLAILYWFS